MKPACNHARERAVALVLVLLLATVMQTVQAGCPPSPPIPAYQATYELYWGPLYVGKAHFRFAPASGGEFVYQSVTRPAGLAALIRDDTITQTSRFAWSCSGPRDLEYRYVRADDGNHHTQDIRFHWKAGTALTEINGRRMNTALQAGTVDQLLAQFTLSAAVARGDHALTFPVLDDGKIETYRFAPAGKPTLDTPFGKVATARYNRRNPRTGRALSLWFAPQYHGVPVRVEQIETGKPTVSLVLGEIKFDTAKSEK